jgi:hypothetical protein
MTAALDLKFASNMPRKPYCTDSLSAGLVILSLKCALTKKYIQMNPPKMKAFMIFDIDREGGAFADTDADLPKATFTVVSPENAHAHLIYALEVPVCVSADGHEHPQRYMKAIYEAYSLRMGADPCYTGLICKNPYHPYWSTITYDKSYSLEALAGSVDLSKLKTGAHAAADFSDAPGRNCGIFDALRKWAYVAIRDYWSGGCFEAWSDAVSGKAVSLNARLVDPLAPNELAHIAKSVSRWTWREITPDRLSEVIARTHTPDLQRERRARSGMTKRQDEVREMGLGLLRQGLSISQVAQMLNVNQSTVVRWKKIL